VYESIFGARASLQPLPRSPKVAEELRGLVSRDALSVVVHDDFGHPLREILELEFDRDTACIRIHAVPDQLGKRMHGLGAGLPRHKVFFYLDLYVLNFSHGLTTIREPAFDAKKQKMNIPKRGDPCPCSLSPLTRPLSAVGSRTGETRRRGNPNLESLTDPARVLGLRMDAGKQAKPLVRRVPISSKRSRLFRLNSPQTRHSAEQSEADNDGILRVTEESVSATKSTDSTTLCKGNNF
jgi:hypothetical protein